jgi:hypothetical protein
MLKKGQKWVTLLVVARKSVLWLSALKSNVSTVTPVDIVLATALSLASTGLPVVTAGMSFFLSSSSEAYVEQIPGA